MLKATETRPEPATRPRPATLDDAAGIVETLARAFDRDPPLNWFLRQDGRRAEAFREFFDVALRRMTFPFGAVEVIADGGDVHAVSLWAPPGKWKLGAWDEASMLPSFARALGIGSLLRGIAGVERMKRRHPHEPPHYYLFALGVDPSMQGRGLGARLLESRLARCDADGLPAYLEATTPNNRRLYARWGFVAEEEELIIGKGAPPLWPMWREPQRKGST
jgi:GNAT superfamily N-acetyltransferase